MLAGFEARLERLNLPPVHVMNGMPCVAAAEVELVTACLLRRNLSRSEEPNRSVE